MPGQPSVKRNMLWNTAGLGVEIASGFILLPLLISRLGSSMYGIWVILGAVASYFALVELGVRGSIGRHVALYYSNGNQPAVNQTVSNGLLVLASAGALSALVLLVGEPLFYRFYDIPDGERHAVHLTYRTVTLHFFISLVGTAFDATLWGHQRFDWLNLIDIPVLILRVVLIYTFVRNEQDIVTLAVIMLVLASLAVTGKALLCYRANPALQIGPSHIHRANLTEILGYGSWSSISTLSRLTRTQLGPLLIGSILGIVHVPLFSIASRLPTAVASAMNAIAGVLTPHATALHGTQQLDRQRHLFLVGGLYCSILTAFFVGVLLALGDVIIDVWVGPAFGMADRILMILLVGEFLPLMQYVTISMLYAKALHRSLAVFSVIETVAVATLMVTLIPLWGLIGVGLAIAIPAFFARGIVPLVQGCRTLHVSIRTYLIEVIVPAIICMTLPVIALRLVTPFVPTHNWWSLIGFGMAYVACFGLCYLVVLGPSEFVKLYRSLRPGKPSIQPEIIAERDSINS